MNAVSGTPNRLLAVVGLVGFLLIGALTIRILSAEDWDPTVLTAFGEEAIPTTEYARARLGDVILRPRQGHDGKFFFVQANDPLVLNPDENAVVLDRPLYRSQRMLYPLLAGGAGLFSPTVVAWGLIVVNVIAFGIGTYAAADIAVSLGRHALWGFSFTLNVGLVSELIIDGAGVVAAAAAFGAVALFMRGRPGLGIGLLLLAALSREVFLVAAAGVALWHWQAERNPKLALKILGYPVLGVGLWAIYLRRQIGWGSGVSEVQEFGWPFAGFLKAASDWLSDPSLDLAVGLVTVAIFFAFTWRVIKSKQLLGWAFLGFVAIGVTVSRQVWGSYFDISRAVAPLLTAFVLLIAAEPSGESNTTLKRTGVRL